MSRTTPSQTLHTVLAISACAAVAVVMTVVEITTLPPRRPGAT